jgi:hypothetical protein
MGPAAWVGGVPVDELMSLMSLMSRVPDHMATNTTASSGPGDPPGSIVLAS